MPTPKTWQVKYSYQPAHFELDGNRLTIHNELFHTNLTDHYDLVWVLADNGKKLAEGQIETPSIGPGEKGTVSIEGLPKLEATAGSNYQLKVSLLQKDDTQWARLGHEVAWGQFALGDHVASPLSPAGDLTVTENDAAFQVGSDSFSLVLDKTSGQITSLNYGGKEILSDRQGPLPNLYRAPGDNDGYAKGQWRTAGLSDLKHSVRSVELTAQGDNFRQITVHYLSQGLGDFQLETSCAYTIFSDGSVAIDSVFSPSQEKLTLPRVGLRLFVNADLETVNYYGRGPLDNYIDRKTGQAIGRYASTATDMYVDYAKPQFMGNRSDVRWTALTDKNGNGLVVTSEVPINFSALHFTDEGLSNIRHPFEIQQWDEQCDICGSDHSFLDEVITDDEGGRVYVCSDTDYCHSRSEAAQQAPNNTQGLNKTTTHELEMACE